jgi:geranylgeranyl pyrophosphate synthase
MTSLESLEVRLDKPKADGDGRTKVLPSWQGIPGLELVQDELQQVEIMLREVAQTEYPELRSLLRRAFTAGGKRLRPALTLLAGKFHPTDPSKLLALAASIETLHTATLIHDDVIDQSLVRRGHPTMNVVAGTKVTILAGDYLFARAAEFAAVTKSSRIMDIFARGLMTLCAGEIRQNYRPPDPRSLGSDGLEAMLNDYHRRIYGKTASLFEAATESAAVLSGAPEDQIQALRQYGYNLGMAFQIVDDVLDFTGDEKTLGKPAGSDLRQGLVTLPVINYLAAHPAHPMVMGALTRRDADGLVDEAVTLIRTSPAIPASLDHAWEFAAAAQAELNALPDNIYRQGLYDLAEFVVKRDR